MKAKQECSIMPVSETWPQEHILESNTSLRGFQTVINYPNVKNVNETT